MAKTTRTPESHSEPNCSANSIVVPADARLHPLEEIRVKLSGASLESDADLDTSEPQLAKAQPLGFRRFPDGTIVDLVRNPSLPQRPFFLISKDGNTKIQEHFHHGGHDFVPPKIDQSLFAATQLPSGVAQCADAPELLGEIGQCIAQYVDIEPQHLRLVTNFILSTWFVDCCEVAPYLWVIGPSSGGKTTLLRILHALCRRAIMASDISPAALYGVPGLIMPTLLLDEFEATGKGHDRDLLRLLRTGNTIDGQVIRRSGVFSTFCAKAIVSRHPPSDGALASRAIFVSMLPTRRELLRLDAATHENISRTFQPWLLAYRLKHFSDVASTKRPRVHGFTPRVSDIGSVLAAPLLGNAQLESQLWQDLSGQDKEAEMARHSEPEWAVATAIYRDCHSSACSLWEA